MSTPTTTQTKAPLPAKPAFTAPYTGLLQRKCACGGSRGVDGECEECRNKRLSLQRQPAIAATGPATAPPIVQEVLSSPGQPLDAGTRGFMEPRFGHDFSRLSIHHRGGETPQTKLTVGAAGDLYEQEAVHTASAIASMAEPASSNGVESRSKYDFSQVRIHRDGPAAKSARAVHALAYTVGNHIVFGAEQFKPETQAGRHLLAHELTHTIQQAGTGSLAVRQTTGQYIARAPLDLNRLDQELFWGDPLTQQSGEIGHAAAPGPGLAPPTEDTRADMEIQALVFPRNTASLPMSSAQGQTTTPGAASNAQQPTSGSEETSPSRPPVPTPRTITGSPDRSHWRFIPPGIFVPARRALVIGGIHGDERGPLALVDQLTNELRSGTTPLARDFDTIVIPRMNPGGVADHTRTNRRGVDLNRNFPGLPGAPNLPAGQTAPPEQPEVTAVRRVIEVLQPERILALHAIGSSTKGGVYSDPVEGMARELACRMALRMRGIPLPGGGASGDVNVRGNQVAKNVCTTRYPEQASVSVTTAQSSLGAWASAPVYQGGRGIPVITHEVADKNPLSPTGAGRSVDTIMPGIREFLLDNEQLPSEADAILRRAVSNAFLTGRGTSSSDVGTRSAIQDMVQARLEDMNLFYRGVWLPQQPQNVRNALPQRLTAVSTFRSFQDQMRITRGALGQQALFQAASTDAEITQAILNVMRTISVPGISRHHWGTEVDVVSATRSDWEGSGRFVPLIPFLRDFAPRFGFFHPYSDRRPDPTLPHYENEPWHLSYWPIANVLQQEWLSRITGSILDNLITETARAIHGPIDVARVESILRNIGLAHFQSNVAPSP